MCTSQTFCARAKDDLHLLNLVFVLAQNTLGLVEGQGIKVQPFGLLSDACQKGDQLFLINQKHLAKIQVNLVKMNLIKDAENKA